MPRKMGPVNTQKMAEAGAPRERLTRDESYGALWGWVIDGPESCFKIVQMDL